jgi:putative membrane protein insertion efficiency factor
VGASPMNSERERANHPGTVSLTLQAAIRIYQLLISPLLPPTCRFLPSCSEYAAQAIQRHGPLRGLGFALRRLARCHPWGDSGYDPVPEPDSLDRLHASRHR